MILKQTCTILINYITIPFLICLNIQTQHKYMSDQRIIIVQKIDNNHSIVSATNIFSDNYSGG